MDVSDAPRFALPEATEPEHYKPRDVKSSSQDALAESISLRPSWSRAVSRPGAAPTTPTQQQRVMQRLSTDGADQQQQQQPQHLDSGFLSRRSTDSSDGRAASDMQVGASGTPSPVAPASGGAAALPRPASQSFAIPANASALSSGSGLGGSGVGQQLFGSTCLMPQFRGVSGRSSFGTDGGAAPLANRAGAGAISLQPGSPLGSGRASPTHGGAFGVTVGGGGASDGDGNASYMSASSDGSPTAVIPSVRSPFRASVGAAPTDAAAAAAAAAAALMPPPQPRQPGASAGGGAAAGASGGGGGPTGLGNGVYLVVDPNTLRVVGTAHATGTNTPGSIAPSTPGGIAFATPSGCGGGHTPITGSARSSMDMPTSPLAASGASCPADITRAALSFLGGGAGGGAGGGGSAPPSVVNAATAAAVSHQNAMALASLSAAAAAAESASAAGGGATQPTLDELLMLLAASGGAGAGGPGPGGGMATAGTSPAAALASSLDPATAAMLLNEGLTAGGLSDDVALALARAAGVFDGNGSGVGGGAAGAAPALDATAANAALTAGLQLPLPIPVPVPVGAPPAATGAVRPSPPPGFGGSMLPTPMSPGIFSTSAATSGRGLPSFASTGPLGGAGGLGGLGSPGPMRGSEAPSWRTANGLGGLSLAGSPGAAAAALGARTTQAAAALAPQGLLAGLASPPGPRGTGPKHNTLYKTEMCRSWTETGSCRYGSKCQFAHGTEELRPIIRHPKYKTEHCRTYAATGACQYGNRCRFIHAAPPGAAFGTPRPGGPGVGGEGGLGGLAALEEHGGGEGLGAGLWARAGEPGGIQGLPAAAASLLSPTRLSLFSPTGRGGARHSALLTSPPYKMARNGLASAAAAGGGGASGSGSDPNSDPLPAPLPMPPSLGLDQPGGGGGATRTASGVGSGLALLEGAGGAGSGGGSSGVDAALQLFSAFGAFKPNGNGNGVAPVLKRGREESGAQVLRREEAQLQPQPKLQQAQQQHDTDAVMEERATATA
ncbi:hypothetical protein GPECTOR_1g538 [Gonium pectorale]|uniref:C3H1-type domain-containing protein n=1 Tax=Gonium pectorale TaxID=33097 RepID=A0A150H444_GONPE|nr:hypothetical protein GPECTOR_1g538 [Gonium pectorale]|eukprot:KXZ56598.1 hypothetical protein GPECTOR_1g538 [Gonium pectorale]